MPLSVLLCNAPVILAACSPVLACGVRGCCCAFTRRSLRVALWISTATSAFWLFRSLFFGVAGDGLRCWRPA